MLCLGLNVKLIMWALQREPRPPPPPPLQGGGWVWGVAGRERGGFLVVVLQCHLKLTRTHHGGKRGVGIRGVRGGGGGGGGGGGEGGGVGGCGGGGGGFLVVVMQCLLLLTGMHHSYTTHT